MMTWKKSIILCASSILLIVVVKIAYSCLLEQIYYAYPSFFGNKAPGESAYRPFFYVAEDPFYNNYDDNQQDNSDLLNKENIQDWKHYTKTDIALKDIDSLVNKFNIRDIKDIAAGKTMRLSTIKKNNAFTKWLIQHPSAAVTDYLTYAKQCEPYVVPQSDWDTLVTNTDSSEILIRSGLALRNNAMDNFLKSRYTFQVLRLAFYNKKYDQTLHLYDSLIGTFDAKTATLSDYRSLGLEAGVYYSRKNYPMAAYLYAKMFDGPDGVKNTAMISFFWSTRQRANQNKTAIIDSALQLCTNDHQRAVITIMQALRSTQEALPLIKKAYTFDPKIKGIDVLVNREINKMEERYQQHGINQINQIEYDSYYYYFEGQPANRQDYLMDSLINTYPGYLGALNSFSQKMIREGKTGNSEFWHLSSAYISYMLNDTKQMNIEMAKAKAAGMSPQELQLYQVFNILKIIKNNSTITAGVENELLPQLKTLDSLSNQKADLDHNFYSIMNLLLAPKYLAQKDTIKALYCMAHSKRFNGQSYGNNNWLYYDYPEETSEYNVDAHLRDRPGEILDKMNLNSLHALQAFLDSSPQSDFTSWLVSGTFYNHDMLKQLEGTKYIRCYQFRRAADILKNVSNLDSLAYPFEMHINDITDTIYTQDTSIITTKYTFARQMAALQDIIKSEPDNAPALYKYALGLYGMSYYGRSPNLFSYFHSTTDEYKYYKTKQRDQLPDPFQQYYGLYTAEMYFNLAAKAAKTNTLKAKCTLGAAKCWQKRCTKTSNDGYFDLNYVGYSLTNPYFKILKAQYSSNEFTKGIYNTCSFYRDFISKN